MKKKERVLDRIIELDNVQKNQLEDPELKPDDFDEVVEEKAKLIEQLDQLDSGFEKLFERMKEELEGNKEAHKEEIRIMQQHIKSITDKKCTDTKSGSPQQGSDDSEIYKCKKQAREVRKGQNVVNKYYKNMTNTNYVAPQFMDNKN